MITEKELTISGKSYINKDFVSIYREIVDLAKTLSYKFDPETSNESDVAVVLLKLMSFIGDKVNYNTDKNVLERFMPSATQDKSMRELCEMMGYNMNYYIAPETYVTIRYTGDADFNNSNHISFTLPRLSTIVTDDNNNVNYILTRSCTIYGRNRESSNIPVIEGELKTLSVLDSDVIKLENLDENNRIYFSDVMVAQNGIFIEGGNVGTSEWEKVDNLNVVEYNSVVYKFSFDSTIGLPYVEFPDYISNLIGDGLTIRYIVTDGENGNVSSKILTKVSSPSFVYWDNSTQDDENKISFEVSENESPLLIVTNLQGAFNGSSPESINQAYINFKKLIGTFTTLVTCRDYRNFLYNQLDNSDMYYLTSNLVVSDRKDDYNFTTNIVTYDTYGKETVSSFNNINAFDLCVYPLNSITQYTVSEFNNSFRRLQGNSVRNLINSTENSKCINHDFKYDVGKGFTDYDTFIFKNYLHLNAIITPKTKVTKDEANSIKLNINQALIETYNARNVDFGYEIPYDSILDTIYGADERIKTVSLFEPELTTKVVNFKGNEDSIKSSNYAYNYLAKNILAGKIDMFDYDETFNYDYGQSNTDLQENIKYMTTEANINVTNDEYKLQNNEVIQLIAPNLITQVTYPYGINYNLKLSSDTKIDAGEEYELGVGEYFVVEYEDVNNNQIVVIYGNGDGSIIKPKRDLNIVTSSSSGVRSIEIEDSSKKSQLQTAGLLNVDGSLSVLAISASQQVEYRTINQEVLNDGQCYCTWFINNSTNTIEFVNDEYMLEEGEYFYRTDVGFNTLYTYGSGTVIKKTGFVTENWSSTLKDKTTVDNISDFIQTGGLLAETNRDVFKLFTFNDLNTLSFLEQQIITLVQDDFIKFSESGYSQSLTNTFTELSNSSKLQYKFSTDKSYTSLPVLSFNYDGTLAKWKIRSRLDINVGPNTPQTLLENQSINIYNSDTSVSIGSYSEGDSIETTIVHQTAGGNLIDIQIPSINTGDVSLQYTDEKIYKYELDTTSVGSDLNMFDCYRLVLEKSGDKTYKIYNTSKETLVMIYASSLSYNYTIDVNPDTTTTYQTADIYRYYEKYSHSPSQSITINSSNSDKRINIFSIKDTGEIKITNNSGTDDLILIVSKPRVINGLSSKLNLNSIEYNDENVHNKESDLIDKLKDLDTNEIFYLNHTIDSAELIETDDLLSPYSLYEYNNIINKWVISQIDFDNISTDITIAYSSIIK